MARITTLYFNQTKPFKLKSVDEFKAGGRYLMVHDREPGEMMFAPPSCSEVYGIAWHHDTDGHALLSVNLSSTGTKQSWFTYAPANSQTHGYDGGGAYFSVSAASDHGFEKDGKIIGHEGNWIVDLDALEAQGIQVLLEPMPGTDMENYPDPYGPYGSDDYYDDLDYERDSYPY